MVFEEKVLLCDGQLVLPEEILICLLWCVQISHKNRSRFRQKKIVLLLSCLPDLLVTKVWNNFSKRAARKRFKYRHFPVSVTTRSIDSITISHASASNRKNSNHEMPLIKEMTVIPSTHYIICELSHITSSQLKKFHKLNSHQRN